MWLGVPQRRAVRWQQLARCSFWALHFGHYLNRIETMDKIDKLKFVMQRIDNYYNGVNGKGSFFLGVNTFVLGGCIAAFQARGMLGSESLWLNLNFSLITILSLLSIGDVLRAILPFLTDGHSYDYESGIFFGSIAEANFKQFKTSSNERSEADFEEDMLRQIHVLSKGLKRKYIQIRNAGILLFLSILAAIPFFFQIIQLKP